MSYKWHLFIPVCPFLSLLLGCAPVQVKVDYDLETCTARAKQLAASYEDANLRVRRGNWDKVPACPGYEEYLVTPKNVNYHVDHLIYLKLDPAPECRISAITSDLCYDVLHNFVRCRTYGKEDEKKAIQLGDQILRPYIEQLISKDGLKLKPGFIDGTRIGNSSEFKQWCKSRVGN